MATKKPPADKIRERPAAPQSAPYGSWRSPITSDLIVAESISLVDVLLDGDDVYWIEGRPREGGRCVLVRRTPGGQVADATPPPFNVRTRVHEYGGGAAVVFQGTVYFANFADQRLYRQDPGAAPGPVTPAGPWRYADGLIDGPRRRWIGVREDHSAAGREPVNTIVAVDLAGAGAGDVLTGGNDFYSSPRLSPDGKRLAWLTWRHPHMPWDGTELWVATFAADGRLQAPVRVAGGDDESIFQPEWSPDGRLYFVSDQSGWWNLYRWDDGRSAALCPRAAEFGDAQWVFGMATYGFLSANRLVCSFAEKSLERLAVLDLTTGHLSGLDLPFTEFSYVRTRGQRIAFRSGSPADPPAVVLLDQPDAAPQVLRVSTSVAANPVVRRCFSTPQTVEFPTAGGKTAFGLYYPAAHPDYAGLSQEKPPLVVKCHGGPTGSASSTLDLRIQYWTSRGIAVLDVNYGGSTGFGRAYRQRLNLRWGIVDVEDCVNGARYLAEHGQIDGQRAVITGGSAGGYTTLAALTFDTYFKGGASHYGVSDLEALALDTHKFESRYLDGLIGPYPAQQALYRERSPIYHVERLTAPVIFFQGDEDKIVPPDQAQKMVEALRAKKIPAGYLLFHGEQHGFRQAANIRLALDAELHFYATLVFKIGLAY
jgi:dipeptidyl aminopeptidase/acylaminoacyl peptidase